MKKITYAQKQGKKSFNWNKFLSKNFTKFSKEREDELFDADELASNWVTCACGNQCAIIPRCETTSAPKDGQLYKLGSKFCDKVSKLRDAYDLKKIPQILKAQEQCQNILEKIEERSFIIIKKMKHESNKN